MNLRFIPLCVAVVAAGCPERRDSAVTGVTTDRIAIAHVTVVDVESGRRFPDRTVLVSAGRIQAIDSSGALEIPSGATVVDASGKFLLPGLWAMHVHTVRAEIDFALEIANGITGVRDMGGSNENPPPGNWRIRFDSLRAWREAIWSGAMVGPRIVAAGIALDGPNPYWRQTLSLKNPGDARRTVDSLRTAGVDFIKVYQALPSDIYLAIAEETNAVGLPFAGHLPDSVALEEAAAAAQRSIEHASLERLYDNPDRVDSVARCGAMAPRICSSSRSSAWKNSQPSSPGPR